VKRGPLFSRFSSITRRPSLNLCERPFLTLFVVSAAVAIVCALADVLLLAADFRLGRLHQIQALSVIWGDLAGPYVDLLEYTPVIVSVPFDLGNSGGFFRFLSLAMLTGVATTWALACLALPLVAVGRVVFPCRADRPASCWFWQKAYPLAIVVVAFLPEPIGAAHVALVIIVAVASLAEPTGAAALAAWTAAKIGFGLFYAGIVWWLLMRMLRQPSQVARFLRVFKPPREVPTNFSTS